MTLASGTRLGSYEILAPIGAGGMGEVYRGLDTRLHREVAIKVLPETLAGDEERLARFEREARLLAILNHPAIATIHGLEYEGPLRFIVMELVSGETLADRLGAGPLPVPEAIRIGRQIAEGLEAAHAKGVIHCDLKPANIAVTLEGRVKLLDFGLAHAFAAEGPSPDVSQSPTLTADLGPAGRLFGTVPYMSPEQTRGKRIDKRADIWAFGCVFYELLTGRKAFPAETVPETLAAILDRDPDWNDLPAKTPGNVRELLRRCLQKDPDRRLRDIGDARIELDDTLSTGQTREQWEAVVRPNRRLRLSLIVAAALVLVGIVSWFALRGMRSRAIPREKYLAVLPFRDLSGQPGGQLIGDGLAETVSIRLQGVPGIEVVPPSAAVAVSDRETDPYKIARSLGANLILRGAIQREADRVRITYSLLNARERVQIAANMVEGPASGLFDVQDRLVESVKGTLRLPRPAGQTPTPVGLDTASQQERYLQAIGHLQRYDKPASVDAALRLLESLAVEAAASPLVHAALGRAELLKFNDTRDRKWVDLAMESCARAERLAPDLPEVSVTRGELLLGTGQPRDGAAAFRRALSVQPNNFQALLGLANAEDAAGSAAEAEAAYRRAMALQPSYWAGYSQLAAFYYRHGQYAKAAEVFRSVTELTPDNAQAFSNLGGTYGMMGRFQEALRAYQKSIVLAPTDAAYSNIGTTQFYLGHYRESAEAYEKAVHLTPGHFLLWANLADAYRWTKGLEAKARDAYRRAIELAGEELRINPSNPQAHSYLALCLAKTGRGREAEEHAQRALSLEADNPENLYNAAAVSCLGGRQTEALQRLRSAIAAGFPGTIARRDPELASLRGDKSFEQITRAGS